MMRMTTWAALALTALAPCAFSAECKYEAERSAGDSAKGITKVVLMAGAGYLHVGGLPNATRIEVKGNACATTRELLERVTIEVRREGSTLYIEAVPPNGAAASEYSWSRMDVDVTLPDNLTVDARDSSGDAKFEDLRNLKLFDSSGDLKIRRIAGTLDLTDSSGDIDIDRAGDITLTDSSGEIYVSRVSGNVELLSDSAGNIDIREVVGNVHIAQDSSDDIAIMHVKGNAIVDADSSGDITARDITGKFTVLADSSGRIMHREVRGEVSLPYARR